MPRSNVAAVSGRAKTSSRSEYFRRRFIQMGTRVGGKLPVIPPLKTLSRHQAKTAHSTPPPSQSAAQLKNRGEVGQAHMSRFRSRELPADHLLDSTPLTDFVDANAGKKVLIDQRVRASICMQRWWKRITVKRWYVESVHDPD